MSLKRNKCCFRNAVTVITNSDHGNHRKHINRKKIGIVVTILTAVTLVAKVTAIKNCLAFRNTHAVHWKFRMSRCNDCMWRPRALRYDHTFPVLFVL
jgi:hypothetical protein